MGFEDRLFVKDNLNLTSEKVNVMIRLLYFRGRGWNSVWYDFNTTIPKKDFEIVFSHLEELRYWL